MVLSEHFGPLEHLGHVMSPKHRPTGQLPEWAARKEKYRLNWNKEQEYKNIFKY